MPALSRPRTTLAPAALFFLARSYLGDASPRRMACGCPGFLDWFIFIEERLIPLFVLFAGDADHFWGSCVHFLKSRALAVTPTYFPH